MSRPLLRRALVPLINLLDRSGKAPSERPSPGEEGTRFPKFPWDLRTIIVVFPPESPFKFLNLNVLLGITGVPFDQVERWTGSDPKDAFDLQFCLETKTGCASYKQYHSVARELDYRTGEVYFKLGSRLLIEGRWPKYRIEYKQPESDLDISMELDSWTGFQWWAHSPALYCHYTSFCDCRLQWRFNGDSGVVDVPALHDHGWGKNLLPVRLPLEVFRYEVMRLPEGAFAISLWTEGPGGMQLKNIGLIRRDGQEIMTMDRYECQVLEWDTFDNYADRICYVPRRWTGYQHGDKGEFKYEAVRNSQPSTVLGEGFLYGFEYQGQLTLVDYPSVGARRAVPLQGTGYVEQLGRFLRGRK